MCVHHVNPGLGTGTTPWTRQQNKWRSADGFSTSFPYFYNIHSLGWDFSLFSIFFFGSLLWLFFFSGEARVWKVQAAFQTVICTDGNEGTFSRRKLFSENIWIEQDLSPRGAEHPDFLREGAGDSPGDTSQQLQWVQPDGSKPFSHGKAQ